jgi:hypothetical protein
MILLHIWHSVLVHGTGYMGIGIRVYGYMAQCIGI